MFGYIIPNICNLRVFENEIYRATYCGLCKQIKKKFGSLCRLNLSYDMVFLAIFLICYYDEKIEFEKKTCKLHPFKKKLILKKSSSLEKVANIGTILFYYKLKDNFNDCRNIKKVLSLFSLIIFSRAHNKAKKSEEEIENLTYNFIKSQEQVEKEKGRSLDFYSHPTSDCLGKIFKTINKNKAEEEILYRIGYMLGKYIYLMDAIDDLKKDKKRGNFNPFLESKKGPKEIIEEANFILNFSISELKESFEKIFKNKKIVILRNVVYQGLIKEKEKILRKVGGHF